jgi:hypothetical protein
MPNDLIAIDDIKTLSVEDFYHAFANNRLNDLDIPAREYFIRQDIIKETMAEHIQNQIDPTVAYLREVEYRENKPVGGVFPQGMLAIQEKEGMFHVFDTCSSEEARQAAVDLYKKEGIYERTVLGSYEPSITAPRQMVVLEVKEVIQKAGVRTFGFNKDGQRVSQSTLDGNGTEPLPWCEV